VAQRIAGERAGLTALPGRKVPTRGPRCLHLPRGLDAHGHEPFAVLLESDAADRTRTSREGGSSCCLVSQHRYRSHRSEPVYRGRNLALAEQQKASCPHSDFGINRRYHYAYRVCIAGRLWKEPDRQTACRGYSRSATRRCLAAAAQEAMKNPALEVPVYSRGNRYAVEDRAAGAVPQSRSDFHSE